MKIASYEQNGSSRWGVVVGDAIHDGETLFGRRSVLEWLRATGGDVGAVDPTTAPSVPLAGDISLARPVLFPEKIICIGINYGKRDDEYADGASEAKFPGVFVRAPDSLVGDGSPILRPPESDQLDYEGEIVVVMGKGGRRIAEADAESHIAGLTIMNEGTIRDWTRHARFNVTQGKNFGSSGALGPWMVTADEFDSFDNLEVTTRVNGAVRQHDTTANLMNSFARLISYLSTFYTLKPGDLIATGTPTGAGARFDPPKWLVPGDVVEVEVSGVGVLRNVVEDEVL